MANVQFPPIADISPNLPSLTGGIHIHLPKPLHARREFPGEVRIIVAGVLMALWG